jgi:hypothetical protein
VPREVRAEMTIDLVDDARKDIDAALLPIYLPAARPRRARPPTGPDASPPGPAPR